MRFWILFSISCLLPTAAAAIAFEDVSGPAGITRTGESWGTAWGDFDGDGYLDLWATNHKHKPSLYRNKRDGTFSNIIDTVWQAHPHADTHGVAWADFDNDGDQDLIVLCGGGGGTNATDARNNNHFYINENGRLHERAGAYGLQLPLLRGRSPLWFDANRDGRLDLLVTGRVRPDTTGAGVAAALFQQTPPGFTNVTRSSGIDLRKDTAVAQLTDITGDGQMDLCIDGAPFPGAVYDISVHPFEELSRTLNIPKWLYDVRDVTFVDFTGDAVTDAFLTRGVARNTVDRISAREVRAYIQVNTGEKGFRFKATGPVRFDIHTVWATRLHHLHIGAEGHRLTRFEGDFIPNDPIRNVATFSCVLDAADPRVAGLKPRVNTELWGLYIGVDPETAEWTVLYHTQPDIETNWTGFEARIEAMEPPITDVTPVKFTAYDHSYQPRSVLLRREPGRAFAVRPTFFGALDGRSAVAGDFDNDMDVDLYVVRSTSIRNLPNVLYENRGDGTFVEVPSAGGAEGSPQGRGQSVAMADYDRDGYLDLFVTNGRGAYPFNEGPDQLFRNVSSGNTWLQIDLEGTVSNREGIGARVFATTADGRTQLRENGGGLHWAQQDQQRLHFGLAGHQSVTELVIHWPSGIVQRFADVSINQVLRVVEPGRHPADVTADGRVDILDSVETLKQIGVAVEAGAAARAADVNKDGAVDILDLIRVLNAIPKGAEK